MEIILATRNPSKAQQIQALFAGTGIEILSLEEAGIEGEAIEDGVTLEENALKKVLYVRERLTEPAWVMSDDTGIFIDALFGEPGVQAAYWGGAGLSTEERMRYCLTRLEGVEDRRATFRTCVALVSPEGEEYFFTGEASGRILRESAVPPQPKMPYSSIFRSDESHRTWAEMTIEEENAISHRGKAFAQAIRFLADRK